LNLAVERDPGKKKILKKNFKKLKIKKSKKSQKKKKKKKIKTMFRVLRGGGGGSPTEDPVQVDLNRCTLLLRDVQGLGSLSVLMRWAPRPGTRASVHVRRLPRLNAPPGSHIWRYLGTLDPAKGGPSALFTTVSVFDAAYGASDALVGVRIETDADGSVDRFPFDVPLIADGAGGW
jgi:hypothetical protein